MDTIIQADIFFFISSIVFVVLAILLSIALIYIILILRNTKKFVDKVKEEGGEVMDDIRELRYKLAEEASLITKLPSLIRFFRKIIRTNKKKKSN